MRDAQGKLKAQEPTREFYGYFLDLHGYKVSVHDKLLSREFHYLCATLNAGIDARPW